MAQSFLVILLVTLAICHSSHGAPPLPLSNAAKEYLEAHNQARAEVGVGKLRWNESIAVAASREVRRQRDRNRCALLADPNSANIGAMYGANQFWSSVGTRPVTPRLAVGSWVNEKKYYDHGKNSCVPNHKCGLYTAVVWRKTLELGCAEATCVKEKRSITLCFYNPPGNFEGESPY